MSATLLDSFRSFLTPDAISSVAHRLGESESSVSRGLTSAFGSILLGLSSKVTDAGAMRDLHGLATRAATDTDAQGVGGLATLLTDGQSSVAPLGSRLLSMALGGNSFAVSEAIARSSGLNSATASSLLSLVAPVVLGIIGKRVRSDRLSSSGLGSLLGNESESARNTAPAGMAALLSPEVPSAAAGARRATAAVGDTPRRTGMGWAWLAVAAAAILGIIWFASRANEPATRQVATDTTMAPATATRDSPDVQAYSPDRTANLVLPNGTTLNVPARSLESQIVAFIKDSTTKVDETTWFNFDRLRFETGSANLAPESNTQLRNLAAIFTAYPAVHAKIGGYTDNSGDPRANQRLSEQRAQAVVSQLVTLGVDKGRLDAEGYGAQHPVGDNSTEAGRAQNRRIALRITEK